MLGRNEFLLELTRVSPDGAMTFAVQMRSAKAGTLVVGGQTSVDLALVETEMTITDSETAVIAGLRGKFGPGEELFEVMLFFTPTAIAQEGSAHGLGGKPGYAPSHQ